GENLSVGWRGKVTRGRPHGGAYRSAGQGRSRSESRGRSGKSWGAKGRHYRGRGGPPSSAEGRARGLAQAICHTAAGGRRGRAAGKGEPGRSGDSGGEPGSIRAAAEGESLPHLEPAGCRGGLSPARQGRRDSPGQGGRASPGCCELR